VTQQQILPAQINGTLGGGGGPGVLTAHISGVLAVGAGGNVFYNDTGSDIEIATVRVSVVNPPLGSAATFDVNLEGTTIFTTQPNRPSIPASQTTSGAAVPDVTVWPAGQKLTADVDAIGSSFAGSFATLQIGLA
jgi:hypothetical protein